MTLTHHAEWNHRVKDVDSETPCGSSRCKQRKRKRAQSTSRAMQFSLIVSGADRESTSTNRRLNGDSPSETLGGLIVSLLRTIPYRIQGIAQTGQSSQY